MFETGMGGNLWQCYWQAEWLKIPYVSSPLPTCQSINTLKELEFLEISTYKYFLEDYEG